MISIREFNRCLCGGGWRYISKRIYFSEPCSRAGAYGGEHLLMSFYAWHPHRAVLYRISWPADSLSWGQCIWRDAWEGPVLGWVPNKNGKFNEKSRLPFMLVDCSLTLIYISFPFHSLNIWNALFFYYFFCEKYFQNFTVFLFYKTKYFLCFNNWSLNVIAHKINVYIFVNYHLVSSCRCNIAIRWLFQLQIMIFYLYLIMIFYLCLMREPRASSHLLHGQTPPTPSPSTPLILYTDVKLEHQI